MNAHAGDPFSADLAAALLPLSLGATVLDRDPIVDENAIAGQPLRPAAVLVAIVMREPGVQVLLTKRTDHLDDHAGQIAFPGGKIDAGDATPLDAALREAMEEINLHAQTVSPLGYLDPYITATAFCIVPVIATVPPDYRIKPNEAEVEEVFEVPLAFLLDPANCRKISGIWRGRRRTSIAIPHGARYIWGVTARILLQLRNRLARAEHPWIP